MAVPSFFIEPTKLKFRGRRRGQIDEAFQLFHFADSEEFSFFGSGFR